MGNSDKNTAQNMIKSTQASDNANTNSGINATQNRINTLTPRADQQEGDIWNGYSSLASDPNHGIDSAASQRLLSGDYSSVGGGSGNGGSGGGGGSSSSSSRSGPPASNAPSYLSTFHDLQTPTGGFDPTRLNNINTDTSQLRDTSGNYGTTDTSTTGLQNFAKTGGLNAGQLSAINQPTLTEMAATGGYSDADRANQRARDNSAITSTYGNLQDSLNKQRAVGNNIGPGYSSAGFKLARQAAQDQATTAQSTEANIQSAVNANRLSAAGKLGDLGLGTAQLQSGNTLSGYQSSGQLSNQKQSQIDAAKEASAGIDTNTQALINQSRLGGASGESQDTLGRMSIGASSAAAQNALNAADQRFLISEGDQNRDTGLKGMLDTYGASPTQLMQDQTQLFNYDKLQGDQNQGLINSQIGTGYMPGAMDAFSKGLGAVGSFAGGLGGIMGGFGGFGGGGGSQPYIPSTPTVPGYTYSMPGAG